MKMNHRWTDEMIVQNLKIRNCNLTLEMVKEALKKATQVVFVCEAQQKLYKPSAPSQVIYVGVPPPPLIHTKSYSQRNPELPFTFLCIGIICPRKNQIWAVELFKKFKEGKTNVRLVIVGARYIRQYEIDYVNALKKAIGEDPAIEVHDVTENVDAYYQDADVLLFTSTNEVTPMVISEAMSYEIPVITTNIAGIPEMVKHGVEGYLIEPGDSTNAITYMEKLYNDEKLRAKMGKAGKIRFDTTFDVDIMSERYRQVLFSVAPPIILVDMDGISMNNFIAFL